MYEIVPHLYLSSYRDVPHDGDFFIINCTKDLPMVPSTYGGTRLFVDDLPTSLDTMTQNIPLMVTYIEDQLNQGHDVIVHCFAGQQRSASVIAAYLINEKGMSYDQAVRFIKSKKPDAFYDGVHFEESIKRNM